MKARRVIDRIYREQCKDAAARRMLSDVLGGPAGMRAFSAYLKAQRAIRFAAARATKVDRMTRAWDERRASESSSEKHGTE